MAKKIDDFDCFTAFTHCDSCNSCTNNFNPLLAGINLEDREKLDESRSTISYEKGETIFKENTFPSGLFCLNQGKVMLTKSDFSGNKIVTNLYKSVSFIGVSEYLSELPYQSTCIALSKVKICMIKSNALEELISNNAGFTRRLLTSIARDYHQSCYRLLAITKKNMNSRIADALLVLLNTFGVDNEGYIDVYLKRSEIAQICNMNETNVIRHLSALDKSGVIRLDSKKIFIVHKGVLVEESNRIY